MKSFDELIKNYSRSYQVNTDFENGVFAKIEKRRKLKKIRVSGVVGFGLAAVFSIFLFFPGSGSRNSQDNRFTIQPDKKSDRVAAKEEIPVLEDVFFTLTDGEKNYAIEQVSITEEEGI